MRARPDLEGAAVRGSVVEQPHHAEMEGVAVRMAPVRLAGAIAIGQREVDAADALVVERRVDRAAGPGRSVAAHGRSVHARLAQRALAQKLCGDRVQRVAVDELDHGPFRADLAQLPPVPVTHVQRIRLPRGLRKRTNVGCRIVAHDSGVLRERRPHTIACRRAPLEVENAPQHQVTVVLEERDLFRVEPHPGSPPRTHRRPNRSNEAKVDRTQIEADWEPLP